LTIPAALRRTTTFAALTAVIFALAALVLSQSFRGRAAQHSVWVSAAVAYLVQIAAFILSWHLRRYHILAAWGVGTLARFGALAVFAFVVVRAWGLAPTAALISFVVFLFLSTLLEPWLLRS
jgi:hypothetical protein